MSTWFIVLINFNALIFLAAALPTATKEFHGLGAEVFFHTLAFTVVQALLSALICVAVGLAAAPGFARLGKFQRTARWILLLPNMMSPILAVLCLLLTFKSFPYGLWGILLGHTFINSGLCTVWLGERWLELDARWGPVNEVSGGSSWFFFSKGLWPQLLPQVKNTFAVVFALCLASFAVPLVLGGGPHYSTLEVLIYERIHADADVASAVAVGLVQCLLQFLVYVMILKPTLLKKEYRRTATATKWPGPSALFTGAVVALNFIPIFQLALLALSHGAISTLFQMPGFISASALSFSTALSVALILFLALAFFAGWGWKESVIHVPALSGVAVGLAGLLIFKSWIYQSVLPVLTALIWGHVTVLLLPVFRLCAPSLGNLRAQFENVLNQLGASKTFGFNRVYLKLGMKTFLSGACLAGCWSFGEFSVSSLVSSTHPTLPLFIQNLMGSYRLEEAAAAALVLLLLSVISMTLFEVLSHGVG